MPGYPSDANPERAVCIWEECLRPLVIACYLVDARTLYHAWVPMGCPDLTGRKGPCFLEHGLDPSIAPPSWAPDKMLAGVGPLDAFAYGMEDQYSAACELGNYRDRQEVLSTDTWWLISLLQGAGCRLSYEGLSKLGGGHGNLLRRQVYMGVAFGWPGHGKGANVALAVPEP